MSETQALFDVLRQSAAPAFADAIERHVRDAPDRKLGRINALAFAAEHGLDEEKTIAGFLHASRLGLFELSWNVLCPGCGGVLDANTSLKTVQSEAYTCALCAAGYEPTLDEMIEVTFTVSPRVRHIEAHNPHELPAAEYFRQVYWGSGVDLPEDDYEAKAEEFVLNSRTAARRKGRHRAAASGRVHHHLRAGDTRSAVHRRVGRTDEGKAQPIPGVRSHPSA